MNTKVFKADALLVLTALIWGSAFVAQRVGMEHIGPMAFNGIRFALGALSLIPLILRSQGSAQDELRGAKALGAGALCGLLLFAGASLQQTGIIYTTAGNAGFITGLYVVIVPLMGYAFGQRPGLGCWIGAPLAATGMYFLSVTETFAINKGDLYVLASSLFWAAHVLALGWLAPKMNPVRLSCLQFSMCSALSLIAAFMTEDVTITAVSDAALPILYGGLMSVGVAYTLQAVAQRDAPPAHAAIILSLEGAFAALTGWLLIDETLTMRGVFGCALILAGMLTAELLPRKRS